MKQKGYIQMANKTSKGAQPHWSGKRKLKSQWDISMHRPEWLQFRLVIWKQLNSHTLQTKH